MAKTQATQNTAEIGIQSLEVTLRGRNGSRLVIHSGLNEACDSATNYIMTLNWVSTYTAFTNQPDSDCPIQFVLSDSLKVLILRVCMGKPIVLPL